VGTINFNKSKHGSVDSYDICPGIASDPIYTVSVDNVDCKINCYNVTKTSVLSKILDARTLYQTNKK